MNVFMGGFLNAHADALADWQVMHLTGSGTDCDQLRAAYLNAGVKAQVLEFLNSMGDAWGAADLALSRGGASSLAELAANTVPALIAPYPWHADQHQAVNAQGSRGFGWCGPGQRHHRTFQQPQFDRHIAAIIASGFCAAYIDARSA